MNIDKTCAGAVRGEVSGSWKSCAALSPARNGSIPAGESPDAAAAAEPARGASRGNGRRTPRTLGFGALALVSTQNIEKREG